MSDEQNAPSIEEQVKKVLEEEIAPALRMDGGDIELVAVEGNDVQLRLRGACVGCPGAQMTLRMGVEKRLRECIPEIGKVDAVP